MFIIHITGFSGREISKLFISCQYSMIMAEKGFLSLQLFQQTLDYKLQEHSQKNTKNNYYDKYEKLKNVAKNVDVDNQSNKGIKLTDKDLRSNEKSAYDDSNSKVISEHKI
jgi:hypothetical protein